MLSIVDYSCEKRELEVNYKLLNEKGSVFEPKAIELQVDQVLRVLGYSDMERVLPAVRSASEEVVGQVQKVVRPIV